MGRNFNKSTKATGAVLFADKNLHNNYELKASANMGVKV